MPCLYKPSLALIDGDSILFKAGKAMETKNEKGEVVTKGPPHFAFHLFKQMINKILKVTQVSEHRIFLAYPECKHFRYNVAKTLPYKANRDPNDRPVYESVIRDYAINNWNVELVKDIEVDDALGIEQDFTGKTISCSGDKDTLQFPGWHYDYEQGQVRKFTMPNGEVRHTILKQWKNKNIYWIEDPGAIDLREISNGKKVLVGVGQMWFCCQMLLGDKIDNIPSFKGVGPVAVYNVLKDCTTYEEAIRTCFQFYVDKLPDLDYNQIVERFYEQANLVWIKRERSWDEQIFKPEWVEL